MLKEAPTIPLPFREGWLGSAPVAWGDKLLLAIHRFIAHVTPLTATYAFHTLVFFDETLIVVFTDIDFCCAVLIRALASHLLPPGQLCRHVKYSHLMRELLQAVARSGSKGKGS